MGEHGSFATLQVHVQPGARATEILGFREGVLWVRVSAPPREGRANAALLRLLADRLGVRQAQVSLLRGQASREKVVRVDGVSDRELLTRLG